MKTRFLFPYYFKFIGLVLFLLHLPVMMLWHVDYSDPGTGLFSARHLFFISTVVSMVLGLLMIAFSKEKIEDEQIAQLRLDSLQVSLYFCYALLIIGMAFSTDHDATKHIMQTSLWLPLMVFIIRFRWMMFRLNRLSAN